MKIRRLLLSAILILGFALRVFALGSRPPGFTWDEAALGYNAYSLYLTGRDEYGQVMPVIFKSFGDYKPGLYIYFTVPSVAVLGLNEFATRLPSAIFGTLLLAGVYVLVRRLFPGNPDIGICSLLVLAVNPWAIQFSRGAWEANLALLLTTLGTTVFITNLKSKSAAYYLAAASLFGFSFWSYQGAKLFTPLLILALVVIYRKNIKLKALLPSLLLLLLLLLPIARNFVSQSGRLQVFSVFSYNRNQADVREIMDQDHTTTKNWVYYLFHSEFTDQARGILQRYLNYFSGRFIFSEGDWTSLRHSVYGYGYFHLPEIVCLAIGLIYLLGRTDKSVRFLLAWLVLAPLPAALSRDLVSGVRALPLVIPLTVIVGAGLSRLFTHRRLLVVYSLGMLFFVTYYLELYYIHSPYYAAVQWLYPYKPAVELVKTYQSDYSHVYFTDKLGQPYIFFLFYLKYDPHIYQQEAQLQAANGPDVGSVSGFSDYSFGPVFWPQLRGKNDAIFVGDQYELPDQDLNVNGLVRLGEIYYPNGQLALKAVAVK